MEFPELPEHLRIELENVVKEARQKELQEEKERISEAMKENDPEFFAKFGDLSDPENPATWKSSTRKDAGVSDEDRLRYLELDMELSMMGLANLIQDYQDDIAELRGVIGGLGIVLVKSGQFPELAQVLGSALRDRGGSDGPGNGHSFAGSTRGISPDAIVDTVDGQIRADQIPGYRDDPSWHPSPDWADANCTCEAHVRLRAQAHGNGESDPGLPGLYL